MPTEPSAPLLPPTTMSPRDVPIPLYVGLGIALLGFVVSISSLVTSSVNGQIQSCSYQDYGAILAAAACLLCAGLGIARRRSRPYRYRVHPAVVYALAAVLVVFAVVHVLRGLGMIGGPC